MMKIVGLDIGGANLKAVSNDHKVVINEPFALWKHPEKLSAAIKKTLKPFGDFDCIALTMSGELCDCFNTKRDGVNHILGAVKNDLDPKKIAVWSLQGKFISVAQASEKILDVAASNWHAQATWLSRQHVASCALMIDIGSTTTDIIRLSPNCVKAKGKTDMARLASGELVYLGAKRTPLMAFGPTVFWNNQHIELMAEHFATTADISLLCGDIEANFHLSDTADGKPFTKKFSEARLARMVGADLEMLPAEQILSLAFCFKKLAQCRIAKAIEVVLGNKKIDQLFLSGSGAFLGQCDEIKTITNVSPTLLTTIVDEKASYAACAFGACQLLDNAHAKGFIKP